MLLRFLSCDTESGVDEHFRFELLARVGCEGCMRRRACKPPRRFADENPCRRVGFGESRAGRGSGALGALANGVPVPVLIMRQERGVCACGGGSLFALIDQSGAGFVERSG